MAAKMLKARVARKSALAEDICGLDLRALDGEPPLPAFQAGAHIDVHLPGGFVRQYSLCNSPQRNDGYQLAVQRERCSRGGSWAVHDVVREGDSLLIGGPHNRFALSCDASRHLLLAGGIGATPLMAMAWTLLEREADFEMHYFTRSAGRTAFREEIRTSPLAAHVRHWYGDIAGERPTIDALLSQATAGTHLYVCGPAGFIDHAIEACVRHGVPSQRIHYERFLANPMPCVAEERDFTVVVHSTGQRIGVAARESVAEALARAGVSIPLSCEQGICGTCLTDIRRGIPDHRDRYLTEEERMAGNCFTPCCSRSLTPELVLDL